MGTFPVRLECLIEKTDGWRAAVHRHRSKHGCKTVPSGPAGFPFLSQEWSLRLIGQSQQSSSLWLFLKGVDTPDHQTTDRLIKPPFKGIHHKNQPNGLKIRMVNDRLTRGDGEV